ncbi:hypothetical protein LCGC14_2433060 [marine sediment metagenome]|uniref:Uncharacterized protein n=1 Tax=marine sediment metagenome TaxID=412755 RepID=A0A0F9EFA2_9ZZZZ
MELTEENKAVIRDEIAVFLSARKYQTEKMCKEKMVTLEGIVKSVNNKLWAIILLLISTLGYNLFAALAR